MKKIENLNTMFCDPETGICEVSGSASSESAQDVNVQTEEKPVRLMYFTDPICSSCWGIEPQLRKLKLEYGKHFDIEYRMGGLLESWDTYGGRDVSGPQSTAQHWEEAGAFYQMPIDGDVWLEDPLHSSYPPSIAFKAAQLQSDEKSLVFLRRIKEMVFLEKKNITKLEHLSKAAEQSGLDVEQFESDYEQKALQLFEEDLTMARMFGVRGFPTIFFLDEEGNRFLVYGSKPYEKYEEALLKLLPEAEKSEIDTDYQALFNEFPTMTTKEFAVLTGSNTQEAEDVLKDLYARNSIEKFSSKNGELWKKKA